MRRHEATRVFLRHVGQCDRAKMAVLLTTTLHILSGALGPYRPPHHSAWTDADGETISMYFSCQWICSALD